MSKSRGAQFTPGPWFTTNEMQGVGGVKVYGVETRDRYPIANCGTGKLGMDNANLIAAAPAMYEALRALVEVFPSVVKMTPYGVPMSISKTHDNAVAALAQAEARS